MRRSICYCEPSTAFAGDVATWKFAYTTATALPKGSRLKFDLLSKGRDVDWEPPQVNPKEKHNVIWAEMPDEKPIYPKILENDDHTSPCFEFILPSEVKSGETITILIGSTDKSHKNGTRAQTHIQRRRPFHLYIDPKGKGDYKDPEIFTIDIRGNVLKNIRIIAPSTVAKNKRFDVIIRFEDVFGNLTNQAPEGTLVEVSYEHLRENLNWKLFIPETGFINLPNLYFNEEGIYKIQLRNLQTEEKFLSPPVKCFNDYDKGTYWGLLHGESERVDSSENIETCLRHFRDEKNSQFFASSSFESTEETSNDHWKLISNQITEFNEDFRFITYLGFQFFDDEEKEGLRQIIYAKDAKPILRKKDNKSNILKKIYKSHTPKDLISIPSFSMAKGFETTFSDFTPEYERVVEIYNAWGSSECLEKEGNLRPITSDDKTGVFESEKGSIRKALNKNCRFGFVAGGLDDRGIYSEFYESDQVQYSPGLTAIIALEQTREALWQAIQNRSCYATTGERIIVGFSIAGIFMGNELNTKSKPGLNFNRHITGYVAGTDLIQEIAFIRNGTVFHTLHPHASDCDFAIDDTEHLNSIALSSPDDRPPFVYYYIRVLQENGHIAWASPIWIDLNEQVIPPPLPKRKKSATPK